MSKKTVGAIVNGGNDYLIVVKRNQKILHRQIEFQTLNKAPIRRFEQTEKTRNRLTHRTVEVFKPPLNLNSGWIGVKSVIKIFRSGIRNNHDYESDYPTYYISSLPPTSSLIPQGIRRHWTIENRLHWIKDVVTQEDTSTCGQVLCRLQGKASTNISLVKSWVINLLRVHGFDSMTEALDYMSNNLPLLLSFCY